MFVLTFYGYTGITQELQVSDSLADMKTALKSRIRYARKLGLPCVKLGPISWEIMTPDNAVGISDFEGVLLIKRIRTKR
jgi:hypothetical protein